MSEFATYTIEADWDLDGSWADPGEDITEYFQHATINRGFADPMARVAFAGTMRLLMENEARQFSPHLESSVTPWVPIRLRQTYNAVTRTKFQGFIAGISPSAGQYNTRNVVFDCIDATALLDIFTGRIAMKLNAYADEIIADVVDDVYSPPTPNYQAGINQFAASGEQWTINQALAQVGTGQAAVQENARAAQKIMDACIADWGRFFIARDGAPTFYNRHQMPLDTTTDLTIASTPAMIYNKRISEVRNWIEVTYLPRTISERNEVLGRFAPERAAKIAPLETETFVIHYRDPANQALRIGGISVLTPVNGTDYSATDDEGGEGADVSANLAITFTAYADRAEISIENTDNADDAYIQFLQVRGFAVRSREPETVRAVDNASYNAYGQRYLRLNAPLISNNAQASALASYLLEVLKEPRDIVEGVQVTANCDATTMAAVRDLELMQRVDLTDYQSGLSNFIGHVMRVQEEIDWSGVHQVYLDLETPFDVGGTPFRLGDTLNSGHIIIY